MFVQALPNGTRHVHLLGSTTVCYERSRIARGVGLYHIYVTKPSFTPSHESNLTTDHKADRVTESKKMPQAGKSGVLIRALNHNYLLPLHAPTTYYTSWCVLQQKAHTRLMYFTPHNKQWQLWIEDLTHVYSAGGMLLLYQNACSCHS